MTEQSENRKLIGQSPLNRRRKSERGFSMIEMVVVVTIILIISAMALINLPTMMQNIHSDAALRQVVTQLRQAREYSIANRRYVQVTFGIVGGLAQIQMIQRNDKTVGAGPVNPVLSTVPLQAPMQFVVFGGAGDTPDGYGNGAAIEFGTPGVAGGPPGGMFFQSDGELVDGGTVVTGVGAGAANPISGSIFLGVAGNTSTARAVTVMGTTGRIHGWSSVGGAAWTQF